MPEFDYDAALAGDTDDSLRCAEYGDSCVVWVRDGDGQWVALALLRSGSGPAGYQMADLYADEEADRALLSFLDEADTWVANLEEWKEALFDLWARSPQGTFDLDPTTFTPAFRPEFRPE